MAIKREIKAYIETELRDYNDTLRAIGEDQNELLQQCPAYDNTGGSNYDIGNPTQVEAMELMTNKRIRRMEQTCRAIETVINALPEEKYRLVELKYWIRPQKLTDEGIARQLSCDRRTIQMDGWNHSFLGYRNGLADEIEHNVGTFRGGLT